MLNIGRGSKRDHYRKMQRFFKKFQHFSVIYRVFPPQSQLLEKYK